MEALRQILEQVKDGVQAFKPKDESVEALREFQPIVKCLKEARNQGLIEKLILPEPNRGIGTYGHIRIAIVRGGLTYRGEQFLISKPPSRGVGAWIGEHLVQVIVGILSTILGACILAFWGLK